MKKYLLLFSFSFLLFVVHGQNVSGVWKGELTFVGGCFPKNNIEIQLKAVGDGVYGSSYHYLDVNNYIRKEASGYYDAKSRKLVVQEGAVTAQLLVDRCNICIKVFQLIYRKEGDKEYLEGFWTGKLMGSNENCGTGGTITLYRAADPTFIEEKIPTIAVDTGDVRLRFYDNATVDGDIITVLLDKKVALSSHKLTLNPATVNTRLSADTPMVIMEMVAENSGEIPPNTAFLEVMSGNMFHRLFLVSTKNKSARVRFIYDKEAARKPQVLAF